MVVKGYSQAAIVQRAMFDDIPESDVIAQYIKRVAKRAEDDGNKIDWSSLKVLFDDQSEIYGEGSVNFNIMIQAEENA
jgi:hypothetical protein